MRKVFVIVALVILTGCGGKLGVVDIATTPGFGVARERVFKECLAAAKVSQQSTHYADNAEVVAECATQAYYITVSLAKSGGLGETNDGTL